MFHTQYYCHPFQTLLTSCINYYNSFLFSPYINFNWSTFQLVAWSPEILPLVTIYLSFNTYSGFQLNNCIDFKILLLVFKVIHNLALQYASELLNVNTPICTFRSSLHLTVPSPHFTIMITILLRTFYISMEIDSLWSCFQWTLEEVSLGFLVSFNCTV